MTLDMLVGLVTQGLLLCLYVSLPICVVSAGVGLIVSFLQAITSLQDQTLSFCIKLIVVVIALVVAAPFAASSILRFANQCLFAATQH